MRNFIFFQVIFIILLITSSTFAQKQIIINELSQGPNDDWEWIEYIIMEDGTDIRGVYLDDNDIERGLLIETLNELIKKIELWDKLFIWPSLE